jgi:Armadillo/beta-catenin-like repeat
MAHNSDDNRLLIIKAGGVPLILDAMQAFATDARLQRQACWALLTLAALDEVSVLLCNYACTLLFHTEAKHAVHAAYAWSVSVLLIITGVYTVQVVSCTFLRQMITCSIRLTSCRDVSCQ